MPLSIYGQVTDIQTTDPVEDATITLVDPESPETIYVTSTSVAAAGPGGFFTFEFTFEQMLALMGDNHHKTITFKVYDGVVFLGAQDAVISALTFRGTEIIAVQVDASYTPPQDGFLYTVAGQVVETDGTPIPGLDVKVYESTLTDENFLETEQTASDGRFIIRYQGPPGSHPDQASIDIVVRAFDGANPVASAGPLVNPRWDLTLILVRDNEALVGPPAVNTYTTALDPHLDNLNYEDLTADHVDYLARKTGFDETTIATVARAHQLETALGIDAEVFYGLAHAGFPLSTNTLLGLDADTVEAALTSAIADNVIPATYSQDIATITAALAAARLDRAVPQVNPETTTLGSVLTAASLAAGVPRSFAEAYIGNQDPIETFWSDLRNDPNFGNTVVDTIQFTLQAGALTASHAPLVKLLNQKRDLAEFSRAAELAQFTDQDWIDMLAEQVDNNAVSTPAGIPGADETERRSNYGRAISRMVEDIFPSAHLAYHLPPGAATADIPTFVIQNPGFSFERTSIDAFLPSAVGVPVDPGEKETLRQDLLKLQRVFRVAPRYGRTASASVLLADGVASARQIQSFGPAAFRTKYGSALGSDAIADSVFGSADAIASTALATATRARPEFYFPATNVITTPGCGDPDLEAIFGSLDYCACRHCDSVHGPAAYFVDIMNFLRHRPAGGGTVMDKLVARRPELMHVKLNCHNAETPLPTVDLVNEVLERAVLDYHAINPHVDPATWPQTTWDADDLSAHPEKIYDAVYDTYLSDDEAACFPWGLPFDLGLEEARIYLTHLGISRIDLQDAFEWFADVGEDEVYRVDERLGLSPGQGALVRRTSPNVHAWELWGFSAEGTWVTQMNDVEMFLDRSGFSFDQLTTLLRTDLCSDVKIVYAKPCKLKDAEFRLISSPQDPGLDATLLDELALRIRLSRALEWSLFELDMVTRGLGLSLAQPVTTALETLAHFVRVRRTFPRLPLGEVLAWWAPLDTRAPGEGAMSFYEQVVRPNLREAEFAVAAIDTDQVTLNDVRGSLLGILQIDEASLSAALAATGLTTASALNRANLSKLCRVASIARATGLRVVELVTLVHYRSALKDASPAVFAGQAASPVRELLKVAADVRASGFSVGALDYVLRDQAPERFGASDADVTRSLVALIVTLQASDADHEASMPPADLPALDRLAMLLARLYEGSELDDRLGLVTKTIPADATQQQAEAARDSLFPYLNPAGDAYTELGKAFAAGAEPSVRAELLVLEVAPYIRLLARQRAATQALANLLGLEPADVAALVASPQTWLDDLTADAFVAAFDPVTDAAELKSEDFPASFLATPELSDPAAAYRALRKIALVITTSRFPTGLLRWLLANADSAPVDILDLTDLPPANPTDAQVYTAFAGWDWLRRALRLGGEVLGEPADLVLLLTSIFTNFNKADTLALLATSASWDETLLTDFETPLNLAQSTFQSLEAPEALARAFGASKRAGVNPETLLDWAKTAATLVQASEIRGAAQAKYGSKAWIGIAAPLRNRLRERQRDALADYLVPRLSGVADREDLLTHFLMDPEVSSCARTSRLLFATSAAQLFVQRALMGLETDVTLSDSDSQEWVWMKRYRVWEANRKIFLYPENWVSPELRDDKTPLFRRLEEELSQAVITETSVEDAYIHYLEGLHEIARLEICGLYHEVERDSETHEIVVDRLHVFGRTRGTPSRMYYRQQNDGAVWTPWEELPFQVEAPDVIPIVANRRLLLLWPKIEVIADEHGDEALQLGPVENRQSKTHREIRMMIAERRHSVWLPPKISTCAITDIYESKKVDISSSYTRDEIRAGAIYEDVFFLTSTKPSAESFVIYSAFRNHVAGPDATLKHFVFRETFIYEPCRGDFILGAPPSFSSVYFGNSPSNNEGAAVPHYLYPQAQGFQESLLSVDDLRLPVRDSITYHYTYPYVVINAPDPYRVLFPRQELLLDPSRPFSFRDDTATLFIREVRKASSLGVSAGDTEESGQDPADLGGKTLTPYLGLLVETQAATLPADEQAQTKFVLSGGENAATQQQWGLKEVGPKYSVSVHYHPWVCLFLSQVRRHGVDGLLDPEGSGEIAELRYQTNSDDLAVRYIPEPNLSVAKPLPVADIDFTLGGAYSVYNWELFYHIPMYVAERLIAERNYAAAQKWLHYIFNPQRTGTEIADSDCKFYWQIRPFRETAAHASIDDLLALLHYDGDDNATLTLREDLENQIAAWRQHPFSPHGIARMRPTAYMRAVVMKYLDNLIAWGDDLFRQDSLESTNEAVLYYAMAVQILGKRPRKLDGLDRPDYTLDEALDANDGILDDFSNFLVQLENEFIAPLKLKNAILVDAQAQLDLQKATPEVFQLGYVKPAQESGTLAAPPKLALPSSPPPLPLFPLKLAPGVTPDLVEDHLYFCIPPNAKLLGYWDTVGDRLFKLRNCLNIEGVRRSLPLFDPPIDPALLAKAAAQGIDIGTAIADLNAPLPHYRFMSHLGVAKELASQVASLGGALLSALEKRDAEALAVLRAGQEVEILASVRRVKENAVDEARANIETLRSGRKVAETRRSHYQNLRFTISEEESDIEQRTQAADKSKNAGIVSLVASALSLIPDLTFGLSGYAASPVFTYSVGGTVASRHMSLISQIIQSEASDLQARAGLAATNAAYIRRKEEWDFQTKLAERDIDQIERQITAAEIRLAMAELELANHDQQAADSAEVLEYMQGKFTNVDLYSWMSNEVSKLYFQAYNLAVDLARRAQRCFHYELAIDPVEADFIAFGHWDNRRKGLLAGERLGQDLRRMEAAYYEKNRREYELTKRVSLAALDPVALVALRKTGACHFFLPETIFNLDHPSHYLRRIKMVGVSMPAVTGPYTTIGATLTYESGSIRPKTDEGLTNLADVQTIAISVGQDDTGLFEPNLRDERYLPFEGRGVVESSWRLELPASVRNFDYETITDVILTIRYTAREGGSVFGNAVQSGLASALSTLARADSLSEPEKGTGQVRLFSARGEFPEAWRSFVAAGSGGGAAELELDLSADRFPHPEEVKSYAITLMVAFVRFAPDAIPTLNTHLDGALLNGPSVTDKGLTWAAYKDNVPAGYPNYVWLATADQLTSSPGTFTLSVTTGWPVGKDPEDLLLLVRYELQ